MRPFILGLAMQLFLNITTIAQTRLIGNTVQPNSFIQQNIEYNGPTKSLIKLEGDTRQIEIINFKYEVPGDYSGKTFIVTKENNQIISYKYDFHFQLQSTIDSFKVVQLNEKTSLPELVFYITNINGAASWYQEIKKLAIVDFDTKMILFDLPISARNDYGTDDPIEWTQKVSFVNNKMTIGNLKSKKYSPTSNITDKPLPEGEYIYENGKLNIHEATPNLTQIADFFNYFKNSFLSKQKQKVLSLTKFPFYDGVMFKYKSEADFTRYFDDMLDDDDIQTMLQNASFNKTIKIQNKRDATVTFKEVPVGEYLKKLKTKFNLSTNSKVFQIAYTYRRTLEGSSHPEQAVYNYFYFGQTENGYKFCGQGIIL